MNTEILSNPRDASIEEYAIARAAGLEVTYKSIIESFDNSECGWPMVQLSRESEPWLEIYLVKYESDGPWGVYFMDRKDGDMSVDEITVMASRFSLAAEVATRLNGATK
jgi:hypothetical protein